MITPGLYIARDGRVCECLRVWRSDGWLYWRLYRPGGPGQARRSPISSFAARVAQRIVQVGAVA